MIGCPKCGSVQTSLHWPGCALAKANGWTIGDVQPEFNIGDKVEKKIGYAFPGTVRSAFITSSKKLRYVAEMDSYGILHIFNGEQLVRR